MRLESVELHLVDLAFRRPLSTAAGTHRRRPVIYVHVRAVGALGVAGPPGAASETEGAGKADAIDGWGECGALPGGTAVDPPLDEVWRTLSAVAVPSLLRAARARGGELPAASQILRLLDASPASRLAGAALEMAVLDAELRVAGTSLAAYLASPPDPASPPGPVPAGAAVGIPEDRRVGSVVDAVAEAVAGGAGRIRLKIEPGWDLEPLRAVRRAFPDLALQADANGAYRLGTAARTAARRPGASASDERSAVRLAALDDLGLACIEQPLPPGDLPSHAALADLLGTPVALDESLCSLRRLHEALRLGACEVACLKPARLGGLFTTRRALHACRSAGIPAFVGGFFETGLARSANAALATLPGFTLAGDLSDPAGYLEENPCPYRGPVEGRVSPPGAPGVGPPPDPALLAARTTASETFGRLS